MTQMRRIDPLNRFCLKLAATFALAVAGTSLLLISVGAQGTAAQEPVAGQDGAARLSEIALLASQSLLLDATRAGETVVVVGDRGHVLLSDDPVSSGWTQVVVPTRSMLTAVAAQGKQLWAVGHDAVILHSADGGRNWSLQNYAPDLEAPLLDVWFEQGGHGFAVGAYGLLYETFDSGAVWERRSVDESEPHFYALFETAARELMLVGEFGTVLKSTDRGRNWSRVDSPYQGSFFGGLGLSDGSVVIFGLRGNLFRSTDGGDSWQKTETDTSASLLGGAELSDGGLKIVGLSGTLLTSRDSGKTVGRLGGLNREAFSTVLPLADGGLLLVGETGVSTLVNASAGGPARVAPQ